MDKKILQGYEYAKEYFARYGVDVDKAIEIADKTPLSIHCWQQHAAKFLIFFCRISIMRR